MRAAYLATVATVAMLAWTGPGQAETLKDAMAAAYQNNPGLLAARAQLRAVDESVPIALSGWRPSLTVNGTLTRQRTENEITGASSGGALFSSGTSLRTQNQASVQLRQPLFRGFKTVNGTDQAKATVQAQRARLDGTEAQVLLDAATAYLDVISNEAVVDLQRNNVQVLARQLEATQDRFRVGEITRTDVAQSEARLAGAQASLVQAEGDLQRARATYRNVIGNEPQALTQPDQVPAVPGSFDEALSEATANNPNFLAADFTAIAAQEGIDVARGDLLPSVDLVAQYARSENTLANKSESKQAQAQAQVTVPLYQGGAEYARLRQAKSTAGQRRLEADKARLDARQSATAAWESYQAAGASITSIEAQISASQIALEGVQREAEVGSRTVLDVLDAEQELLNARVNLVRAKRNQQVAAYQLLSAMGRLNAEGVGLEVAVYDAEAHYRDVKNKAFGTDPASQSDAETAR
ncbi:MAG: TolC family outer membrane protein [Rhodospirillaceae bacterium]|nr:TolC family outer membrane protein [Rhodospirillaceae bacterium]